MRYDRRHAGEVPHSRVDWFVDDYLGGLIVLVLFAWLVLA